MFSNAVRILSGRSVVGVCYVHDKHLLSEIIVTCDKMLLIV
jgi:hypothetical protein